MDVTTAIGPDLDLAMRPQLPRPRGSIDQTAEDFESFFISQFVNLMFQGLPTDGPFGGGNSETIFRSLLADQYAAELAKGGGFGIAEQVKREMLKMQEVNSP